MKKSAPFLALGIFALTIALFYIVYEYVFYVNLFNENLFGLVIWSLFVGLITFIYSMFDRKYGLGVFLISYVVAFILLYMTFSNTDNTFANITGLLMFIFVLLGGFIFSLITEGLLWFIKKK